MENTWVILIALLIFVVFIFLYWRLSHNFIKKKYGIKNWKHYPNKLSYWQGAVLYSLGFTFLALFILKWVNIINF